MAEATVKLGMDTRPFEQGAAKATTTIEGISTFAAAKFAAVQAVVGKAVDAASSLMQEGMKRLIAEVSEAKEKAQGLANIASHLEDVYHSSEIATGAMKQLAEVSQVLDVSADDASRLGVKLADAGVKGNQLALAVGVLANISSGSGTSLSGLGDIYVGAFKRGYLAISELNAFTAAGIPVQQQLARQMHIPFDTIERRAKAGKISADELAKALSNMATTKGGDSNGMESRYVGASAAALETFDGKLRKIRETIQGFAVQFLGIFVSAEKQGDKAATPLERIKNALKPIADTVLATIQALQPAVVSIAAQFKAVMDSMGEGPDMADKISKSLKDGIGGLGFLQKLPQYAAEFGKSLEAGVTFMIAAFKSGEMWNLAKLSLEAAFRDAADSLAKATAGALTKGLDGLEATFGKIRETLKSAIGYAMDFLTDSDAFDVLATKIAGVFEGASDILENAFDNAVRFLRGKLTFAMQEGATSLLAMLGPAGRALGIGLNGGKTEPEHLKEAGYSAGKSSDWIKEFAGVMKDGATRAAEATGERLLKAGASASSALSQGRASLRATARDGIGNGDEARDEKELALARVLAQVITQAQAKAIPAASRLTAQRGEAQWSLDQSERSKASMVTQKTASGEPSLKEVLAALYLINGSVKSSTLGN